MRQTLAVGILVALLAWVAFCYGYLARHFYRRFKKRGHALSLPTATLPLWALGACILTLVPNPEAWRVPVLSVCLVQGTLNYFAFRQSNRAQQVVDEAAAAAKREAA